MMATLLYTSAMIAGASVALTPAQLDISITSGGSDVVVANSCSIVNYRVNGVLSTSDNEGLARFLVDLAFSGGNLPPADEPATTPLLNFARPAGVTNPAGFGGSVVGSQRKQVGGAQNTINNDGSIVPFPNGTVITGVAHTQTVLVTGSLIAPVTPGTYTLSASSVSGAVIRQGETGEIFWKTDPLAPGSISDLTINVVPCPLFADIVPPGGSGIVDVDDLICVLEGFANFLSCPLADLAPCPPNGNGIVDVDDLIALLAAFGGEGICPNCPNPCP